MLAESDLTAAVENYERSAVDAIARAKRVELPTPLKLVFSTLDLQDRAIVDLATKVPTGKRPDDKGSEYIYLFRAAEANAVPLTEVFESFKVARDEQEASDYLGKKNLCRGNQSADGKVLYVGRSYSPRERFKGHLRAGTSGTYAIHFQKWATGIDLQVDFFLYQFSGIGDRVVQVIEDGLWDLLRPMFGRRGEK